MLFLSIESIVRTFVRSFVRWGFFSRSRSRSLLRTWLFSFFSRFLVYFLLPCSARVSLHVGGSLAGMRDDGRHKGNACDDPDSSISRSSSALIPSVVLASVDLTTFVITYRDLEPECMRSQARQDLCADLSSSSLSLSPFVCLLVAD